MSYDREEDILYLAQQLWEEDDVRTFPSQEVWRNAALEILAQGGHFSRRSEGRFDSNSERNRVYYRLKFRSSPDVFLGRLASTKMVSSFKRCAHEDVSNNDVTAFQQRRAKVVNLSRTHSGS